MNQGDGEGSVVGQDAYQNHDPNLYTILSLSLPFLHIYFQFTINSLHAKFIYEKNITTLLILNQDSFAVTACQQNLDLLNKGIFLE